MKRLLTLITLIIFITLITLPIAQVAADGPPFPPPNITPPKNGTPPITATSAVVFVGEFIGWLVGVVGLMLLTKMSVKRCFAVSGIMMVVSYIAGLLMWYVVL